MSDPVAFPPEGFGWQPIFANDEIAFYRMNGFVWGTWLASALSEDMQRANSSSSAAFALAHNVTAKKRFSLSLTGWWLPEGLNFAMATRAHTADFVATFRTRTATAGKLRGTQHGRLTSMAMLHWVSESSGKNVGAGCRFRPPSDNHPIFSGRQNRAINFSAMR
ncbi:VOC family protein [Allopontixanthobacter confluentis]|uniref:hypothetical protein n=1 Tax=Allopontixanthobacter confluentis TaxID=1849021 RepID=UPI001925BAD8|nr:hypothetical protein [Allopontixanthobacter confluentis]